MGVNLKPQTHLHKSMTFSPCNFFFELLICQMTRHILCQLRAISVQLLPLSWHTYTHSPFPGFVEQTGILSGGLTPIWSYSHLVSNCHTMKIMIMTMKSWSKPKLPWALSYSFLWALDPFIHPPMPLGVCGKVVSDHPCWLYHRQFSMAPCALSSSRWTTRHLPGDAPDSKLTSPLHFTSLGNPCKSFQRKALEKCSGWSHIRICLWQRHDFTPWVIDGFSLWSSKAF